LIRGAVLAAMLLLVTGCGFVGNAPAPSADVGLSYPAGCSAFDLSARRCKAIVEWVIEQEGVKDRPITSVELLGRGLCSPDGNTLCKSTASFVVRVRLHLADGTTVERAIGCAVGCEYSILFTETPEISIGGPVFGGYRDVPCANENGEGCGTPLPTADPAAAAAARPLRVPVFDVAIDHVGHYDVEIGRAVLPNGVVSNAWIELANKTTQTVSLGENGIFVDVQSTKPGAPRFENYYLRGWHPGPEEVSLILRFDVKEFEPNSILEIRNVILE
jgi:hypothetical protein